MASQLQGMEYKIVKDYGNGDLIILPVLKFDAPGSQKLIFVRGQELIGSPVILEQGDDEAGLAWGIKQMELKKL